MNVIGPCMKTIRTLKEHWRARNCPMTPSILQKDRCHPQHRFNACHQLNSSVLKKTQPKMHWYNWNPEVVQGCQDRAVLTCVMF
ncbi:unnamed protein product [Cyprideis torosa]|uniref:Uncharacterized protein n=1 Tax=Cyprideis torosa TaxID=163714 RepID=A0A7R8WAX4_9CRUS|nr:unnamed protein product [Cyprideis torosa]CAG0886322.1 unnamed protein product [Cyprideis torosa]